MSYGETTRSEHLRITILRLLNDGASRYPANDSGLHAGVKHLGFAPIGRDEVRATMSWLASVNLIRTWREGDMLVGEITQLGEDVANGDVVIDGIKRPSRAR